MGALLTPAVQRLYIIDFCRLAAKVRVMALKSFGPRGFTYFCLLFVVKAKVAILGKNLLWAIL